MSCYSQRKHLYSGEIMLKKVFSHTKFLEEQNLDFMSQKTDTCRWVTNGEKSTSESTWLVNKSGYLRRTANWSLKHNKQRSPLLDRIKSVIPKNHYSSNLPKTVYETGQRTIWKTLSISVEQSDKDRETQSTNKTPRKTEETKLVRQTALPMNKSTIISVQFEFPNNRYGEHTNPDS